MFKALQKVCTQETQVHFKRLMASQNKSTVAVVSLNFMYCISLLYD